MSKKNSEGDGDKFSDVLTAFRSEDVLTRNDGVAVAIQIGTAVVPELLLLLEESGVSRAQVMYALSQIGDLSAEQAFQAGLNDTDEFVRAYAAQGLVRIGHSDAMLACVQTLNDAADELHLDRTPSVNALGEMGLKAVPVMLDLLMNEDEMTRLHSQRVLEIVVMQRYGFDAGQGFPTPDKENQARKAWHDHGNYDFAADVRIRAFAVTQLRKWFLTLKV